MATQDSSYNLSPELLDAMRENDYRLKDQQLSTIYDDDNTTSPQDIIKGKLEDLEKELSEPLKKIHSIWLARSAKNCYQEKHISDDFTNLEQIKLCREKTRDNIIGSFYAEVHRRRTFDGYALNNWIIDSKEQMHKTVAWIEKYVTDIEKTNAGLVSDFKEQYSKYI